MSSMWNLNCMDQLVEKSLPCTFHGCLPGSDCCHYSFRFGHELNRNVNNDIKKAVKNQLEEDEAVIQVAMKTYFFTKRKEKKREASGKAESFRRKQARRQRKQQKLMRRKETLKKCSSVDEETKDKLKAVMNTMYMSSEDTDSLAEFDSSDDDLGITRKAKPLRKRPLLWRAKFLNDTFSMLDKRHERKLNKMGVVLYMTRREGSASTRPLPDGSPSWAVRSSHLERDNE
ncbi:uncharacterized protein [Ptychodera flava]|uniref:uncharacterized protein n=1 Tax=Ptychodera flava TaxID=63121 RepID=UPI00396A058A